MVDEPVQVAPGQPGGDDEPRVPRRGAIAAVIAAATAAAVLDHADPAAAHDVDDLWVGHTNTGTLPTILQSSGNGLTSTLIVHADSQSYGIGITATGTGYGISATGNTYAGVAGDTNASNGAGVTGQHRPTSGFGYGVVGTSASPTGRGVQGGAPGIGVVGMGTNFGPAPIAPAGPIGVYGVSTEPTGIGGVFDGPLAQLRLVPGTKSGAPTAGSHAVGEIVLASDARLFLCTVAGTPGTWVELGAQPVAPVIPVVPKLVLLPTPERFVDTRIGLGGLQGPVAAGTTHTFQMTGRDGLSGDSALRIPDNATALVGNVAGIGQPGIPLGSFLTLWPSGDRPTVANVNFGASNVTGAINNAFLVGLGASGGHGTVQVFNNQPSDYVLDVTGYYVPSA